MAGNLREQLLFEVGPMRQMTMDLLYRVGGMTNPEIGRLMSVDYSTISQGRKRFRARLAKDKQLNSLVLKIEEELSRIKI